jgi:Flp pilus assembly protein TadD
LKGRYFWNKRTPESIEKAIGYFQQAVAQDPKFALAYSGLADCYNLAAYYSDSPATEAFPKAEQAAQRALSIDNTLAEAYNSLALARMDYKWDFAGAEVAYRRAIELDPEYATAHQWYAEFLIAMGREQEARSEIQRAQELDPLSLINSATTGEIDFFSRDYDRAAARLYATLDLDRQFWPARWFLGWTYEVQGRKREAVEVLNEAHRVSPDDAQIASELAYALAVSGDKERAEALVGELARNPSKQQACAYNMALVYSALGDRNRAFDWLDRAIEARSWMLIYTKVDPRMDGLRSDKRFNKVLKHVGLEG